MFVRKTFANIPQKAPSLWINPSILEERFASLVYLMFVNKSFDNIYVC
jgi:hypothetical protein